MFQRIEAYQTNVIHWMIACLKIIIYVIENTILVCYEMVSLKLNFY